MNDLRQRLLAAFQVEHAEHLSRIRSLLEKADRDGAEYLRADLDEMFRRAHTLKGAARAVDLHPVENLAHRLESLFTRIREGSVALDRPVRAAVRQALDTVEDLASALVQNRPPVEPQPVIAALEQVLRSDSPPDAAPPAVAEASSAPDPSADTLRVSAESLDRVIGSTAELIAEIGGQEAIDADLSGLAAQLALLDKEWRHLRESLAPLRQTGYSLEASRMARELDAVHSRIRSVNRKAGSLRLRQRRSSWRMTRAADRLQRDVGQARLITAESVFGGFRKMVRDLARAEGKEIDFRVSGLETLADRLVLQALKDACMHLLRNAISHGIESPQERDRRGKPRAGSVSLRLQAHGRHLHLEVADDGRGIDFRDVAASALRSGLLSEPEAAAATPELLCRLLFRAGFSTSPQVTRMAGRGMGLSVVQEAVAQLQGEVELRAARDGAGTVTRISAPIAVSTQRLLLVHCAGQVYALPSHAVERLQRLRRSGIETIEGFPFVHLESGPVPVFDLAVLLGVETVASRTPKNILPAFLLQVGGRKIAVLVDAFLAEGEYLVKDLGFPLSPATRIAGGILLQDGAVSLVLSPAALMESSHAASAGRMLPEAQTRPEPTIPTILLVDDSITTRTLEKSILEAHGYQVRVAVDGLEALTELRRRPADLVITDLQMPRLDGFGLLERMKKDERMARIPVIIVSSLERREDQERGLSLGADAYVVKRKFDQRELLDTIRQIL